MHLYISSIVALLCTVQGFPSYHGHQKHEPLEGVPGIESYHKLTYPKFDVIHLGSDTKDHLPPTVVQITKKITVEVPKPYKVEVKVPVPHPVHIPQPYPVVQTKIVKVPHPVHVEVIKKVPYPVEVPKPYPVPHQEYSGSQENAGGHENEFQAPPQQDFGGWSPLQYGGGEEQGTPVQEHTQEQEQH